jgi:hypothetical protein
MSRYAEGTEVPIEKSKLELDRLLTRYGASHYGVMNSPEKAQVIFRMRGRNIRFDVPFPPVTDTRFKARRQRMRPEVAHEAEIRRRWRALGMVIKAKLESVESEITSFEEEFLAHIVLESGETVAEQMVPKLPPASASSARQLPEASRR